MSGAAFEAQSRGGALTTDVVTYRPQQRPWTTGEVKRLTVMWEMGCTAGQIADVLGRTRNSICGAARRYELESRKSPIASKPDLIKQRQIELARIAAIEELMRVAA
jgi:hypothetical protein